MKTIKLISLTWLLFILDVVVWGSICGLVFVFIHWVSNLLSDTDTNLIHVHFAGVTCYLFFEAIAAKFREHRTDATEYFIRDNS